MAGPAVPLYWLLSLAELRPAPRSALRRHFGGMEPNFSKPRQCPVTVIAFSPPPPPMSNGAGASNRADLSTERNNG